tara:strand:- start:162 stop:674 length:513 start_codon:yes stop_codon:yes gene_type:complete
MDYSGTRKSVPENTAITQETKKAETGAQVPSFSFIPVGRNQEITIQSLQGKIVVLNFWASWCPPCVKEFPYFLELAKAYPDQIVFVGLSSDFKPEDMNRFLNKMKKEYPDEMTADNVLIALDENGAITRGIFQTFRLPETVIIDQNGRMQDKIIGAVPSYKILQEHIKIN